MATSERPDNPKTAFEQDPLVDRMRPDPSVAPVAALVLEGLAGRSNRENYVRLYFSTALNHYAEFASADMLFNEAIPPEQPPFLGHKATRVGIRQDAVVDYTRTVPAKAIDPYAVDIRQASRARLSPSLVPAYPPTIAAECPGETFFGCGGDGTLGCGTNQRTVCFGATCDTCRLTECEQATCDTCRTCGDATCQTCNQATCQTCNQATCATCGGATCQTCNQATCQTCNQATCNTCRTDCGGRTCATCDTCNPHVFTCGNQRGCQ